MATTVGQHSVAAFTSPVNGTTPIDANTVRGNDNTVRVAYVDHDADPGIHVQSSTLAARPTAGTAGRKWINSDYPQKLWYDDGTDWHEVGGDAINVYCKATEVIAKGDVVKVTGYNTGQDVPEIAKVASASDVAFGIAETAIANGSLGYVINTGVIQGVTTNSFSLGNILYPNTSGGLTATKPTSGNYQAVAYVLRAHASSGVLYVEFSAPRIVERSDNTASTIVLRDASGNFSAGTITAGAVTSTGLVTFASLKGTGATTVTNILDEDNMASDSATALATQQSIKAYVDAKVATVDTLAEVLANGNTTGSNDIIVSSGQKITTNTIDETTNAAGVTIDSVLLKDDVVNATDIEVDTISANNGTLAVTLGSTGVATIAQQPIVSSLTASQAVFTDASKGLVSNAITGSGNVVMSASPTLTGTVTAATINATTLGGTLSTAAQTNITSVGTLTGLTVTNPISGSVTGSSGSTTGNAATATALQTARNINGVSFNGTADITVTAAAGTLSGSTLASGVTASSLTSVGTLSSLTVSGDLTVDTSTLKVDSTNNSVGIGTATPGTTYQLTVRRDGADTGLRIGNNTTYDQFIYFNGNNDWSIGMDYSNSNAFVISNSSSLGTNDRVVLTTSGNLGLGVTPTYRMQVYSDNSTAYSSSDFDSARNLLLQNANTTTNANIGIQFLVGGNSEAAITAVRTASGEASLAFGTRGGGARTTRMTLDASGYLGIGTTSPATRLQVAGAHVSGRGLLSLDADSGQRYTLLSFYNAGTSKSAVYYDNTDATLNVFAGTSSALLLGANNAEKARITSGGNLLVGKTVSGAVSTYGAELAKEGWGMFSADNEVSVYVNRGTSDGNLVEFYQANALEGSISVSGNTVSYNAFAGSHWSQLEDGSKPEILRGTVMESINELCEWPGEQNERLPKAKVSDTAGSKKVYGVFMDWDNDWTATNDMYITSLGAFICRVAADVVVEQGDLLESNGDGTARVQTDDVIRSSTIGKVTSTVKTHEYEDGTYCVPTVLYCG